MIQQSRSFRTPFSVTLISGMSFSLFWKRFVRCSQRAESFIGIWCEKTEWKCLFKRSAFCSESVTVEPFFFSALMSVESVFFCLIEV